jgi:hypothetical protein
MLKVVDICADSRSMELESASIDELRGELAVLEAKAARLSARRGHLHHQIDFGFESSTTREREREVSDERNELHRQIDSLRELLRGRESA